VSIVAGRQTTWDSALQRSCADYSMFSLREDGNIQTRHCLATVPPPLTDSCLTIQRAVDDSCCPRPRTPPPPLEIVGATGYDRNVSNSRPLSAKT
jgi:hypothetical protein